MTYTFPTPNGQVLSTQPFWNGNVLYASAMHEFLVPGEIPGLWRGICDLGVDQGVFRRNLTDFENTGVDDFLAIACVPYFATRIVRHGRTHLGFFDCSPGFWPKPKQWLWRFFGFWQHAKLSAGCYVGPLGRALWALAIYLAARKPVTNQDGWIQSHLMVLVYARQKRTESWLCEHAIHYWVARKPALTSKIMADYLGTEDHPLVNAWKTVEGTT